MSLEPFFYHGFNYNGLHRQKTPPKTHAMRIGYARVSTDEQTTALQREALEAAGCDPIYTETAGGTAKRPALQKALDALAPGDVLTVWKFDRLARSLPDLLQIVERIEARGAHLRSLTEDIDTSSSAGRLVFHVMGAMAQFERDLIRERTKAGLEAARRAGRKIGRPRALTRDQIRKARVLIQNGESPASVARAFKVGASTLRAAIAGDRVKD